MGLQPYNSAIIAEADSGVCEEGERKREYTVTLTVLLDEDQCSDAPTYFRQNLAERLYEMDRQELADAIADADPTATYYGPSYCSRCGDSYDPDETSEEGYCPDCADLPNCDNCGEKYDPDDGPCCEDEEPYTCKECDETFTSDETEDPDDEYCSSCYRDKFPEMCQRCGVRYDPTDPGANDIHCAYCAGRERAEQPRTDGATLTAAPLQSARDRLIAVTAAGRSTPGCHNNCAALGVPCVCGVLAGLENDDE